MPEVLALIASVLQVDPTLLSDDDGVQTVPQWDSLKIIMLTSMIEITYGITLDNSDIEQLTSVRAVREVIARHVPG
jgi:acyl carrier protein